MKGDLFCLQCGNLAIQHGFFSNKKNILQDHEPSDWAQENKNSVMDFLNVKESFFPNQQHTNVVLTLPIDVSVLADRPADALVTNQCKVGLGVLTADCAPVLFYDVSGVIGIAHVGCAGAITGILENTITAMTNLGATNSTIYAIIGPTIRQYSYEVRDDFRQSVEQNSDFFVDDFFDIFQNKMFFNLPKYIYKRLEGGALCIYDTGFDTFGEFFFSRRYAARKGKKNYGSNISMIALP